MRYLYSQENLSLIFIELKKVHGLSWNKFAAKYFITNRTLFSWRKGKASIPDTFINVIQKNTGFTFPAAAMSINEQEQKISAAQKGGKSVIKKYGNPGTTEGRVKGGINSYLIGRERKDSIFQRNEICKPVYSDKLAELVGIILGDGCITPRQVSITLHKYDDKDYSVYVRQSLKTLFGVDATLSHRKNELASVITISRTDLVDFLEELGLKKGSKVKQQAKVPNWILKKESYKKSCIRGLVDTDGCFFIDRHYRGNIIYSSQGLNFTNRSLPLLAFLKNTLKELGFNPTQKTTYAVFLRKKEEIEKYFNEIGTSNPKFLRKRKAYLSYNMEE